MINKSNQDQNIIHHYLEGETFESIAKKYGTTVKNLKKINPELSPTNLYEGLKIIVSKSLFSQENEYAIKSHISKFSMPTRAYGDYKPLRARSLPPYMDEPPRSLNWFYQINVAYELIRSGIYAIEKNGNVIVNRHVVHIQGAVKANEHVYATGRDIMYYLKTHHPYSVTFPPLTPAERKSIIEEVNKQVIIAGKKYEIDPYLLKAIIAQESLFNPRAVSVTKAEGLMQLMPQIIRELKIEDSFDIIENIDGGARHFKVSLNIFPDNLEYAIASYTGGIEHMVTEIPQARDLQGMKPEIRFYVHKVLGYYAKFKGENNLK